MALGGLFRCGCNYICTRLLLLTSTIGIPSTNYKEGETQSTKGCQTYGEAASTVSINQGIGQCFELFFRGFADPLWFLYLDNENLTLPFEFSFETGCNDVHSIAIFNAFIHPCILPAEFCGGRQVQSTFEY
jgi:hypothetical protein